MFKPKTHFDQVPLEIVRKIVEEQIEGVTTTEPSPGIEKRILKENLLGGPSTIGNELDMRRH
jgi:hypothetical protein